MTTQNIFLKGRWLVNSKEVIHNQSFLFLKKQVLKINVSLQGCRITYCLNKQN